MAAFGSEERSAHEQPPAASIQKVAIVHVHIIPYWGGDIKWTKYKQFALKKDGKNDKTKIQLYKNLELYLEIDIIKL